MRRFALIPVAIVAVLVIWASCINALAKQKPAVTHEPRVIKLENVRMAEFSSPGGEGTGDDEAFMRGQQANALLQAKTWLRSNKSPIRVISHSLTGNYVGGGRSHVCGFSTVTILYEEK